MAESLVLLVGAAFVALALLLALGALVALRA